MTRQEKEAKEGNRTNEIPKDSALSILFYIVALLSAVQSPTQNPMTSVHGCKLG